MRLAVLGVPALALIGALALACFAKAAGVVFLGHPRSSGAAAASEAPGALVRPMLVLALLCVVLGVAAPLGVAPALRVAATLAGAPASAIREAAPLVVAATWIAGVAGVLVALVAAGWWLRRTLQRRRQVRMAETWGCGYELPNARMQYTASSFAAPILSAFGRVSGVREERSAHAFHTVPRDLVLDTWALPLWEAIRRAALRLRPLQQGRLSVYLIYVLAALLALLLYVAVEVRRLR
jgi:NADH:ubiquinone oxidoreductase subunit 5 (subunit L)/multisubunit Na+/H+ antiporter MnhA subunit